jgi:hypothetical protein
MFPFIFPLLCTVISVHICTFLVSPTLAFRLCFGCTIFSSSLHPFKKDEDSLVRNAGFPDLLIGIQFFLGFAYE